MSDKSAILIGLGLIFSIGLSIGYYLQPLPKVYTYYRMANVIGQIEDCSGSVYFTAGNFTFQDDGYIDYLIKVEAGPPPEPITWLGSPK